MTTSNTPDTNEIIILDEPTAEGSAMFDKIAKDVFDLERFLRQREQGSKSCQPLHRIRWALSELKKHYNAGDTVCDKHTKLDDYLAENRS